MDLLVDNVYKLCNFCSMNLQSRFFLNAGRITNLRHVLFLEFSITSQLLCSVITVFISNEYNYPYHATMLLSIQIPVNCNLHYICIYVW